VSAEPSQIERWLDGIDGVRGLLGLLFFAGIGVAAIRAGGAAGWALGIVLLTLCAVGAVRFVLDAARRA
jgi:hypothetical protein